MHEVLVNRLGGLSLPRKSVIRLTDRPHMTLDVYRAHKTTIQQRRPPPTPPSPVGCDQLHMILLGNMSVYFLMNMFVFFCPFFSLLFRMGLCVQLVCTNVYLHAEHQQYYNFTFAYFQKNDGLDILDSWQ